MIRRRRQRRKAIETPARIYMCSADRPGGAGEAGPVTSAAHLPRPAAYHACTGGLSCTFIHQIPLMLNSPETVTEPGS